MLSPMSNQAKENVKLYILEHFNPEGYTEAPPRKYNEVARFILAVFRREKYNLPEDERYYHGSEQAAFIDWCAGLPSILDTCYYCNRSAVEDLAQLLQMTKTERKRYSEERAEDYMSRLLYRILKEGEA